MFTLNIFLVFGCFSTFSEKFTKYSQFECLQLLGNPAPFEESGVVSVALFLQRACLGGLHPERMNIKPNLLSLWSMMLAR
jgi:hypothetical protein